jgi:hypothetical protein
LLVSVLTASAFKLLGGGLVLSDPPLLVELLLVVVLLVVGATILHSLAVMDMQVRRTKSNRVERVIIMIGMQESIPVVTVHASLRSETLTVC